MAIGSSLLINNVVKYYKRFKAVDNVSVSVKKGEFLTILGPSGSGKTSLLKLIAGFEDIYSGDILLNNESIQDKKPYERNIGMLFQNYALFPHMTIFDNIAYPLKIRKYSKNDIKKKVNDILEMVDLKEVQDRFPKQLSGGQQQRVALARAIVFNPPLLLLDEPLGALDKHLRQRMQIEIKHIQQKIGITTISVTHDQEEALTMSDKVCIMNKGRIEQVDTPENIYQKPKSKFVAKFIGEINLFDGTVIQSGEEGEKEVVIKGVKGNIFKAEKDAESKIFNKQKICVAVRPENIKLASADSNYDNVLNAVVKEVIFIGNSLKVKAVTKSEIEVMILVDPSKQDKLILGKDVSFGWNKNDCCLIS